MITFRSGKFRCGHIKKKITVHAGACRKEIVRDPRKPHAGEGRIGEEVKNKIRDNVFKISRD